MAKVFPNYNSCLSVFIPKKHLSSILRKIQLKCFFGIKTLTQRKLQPEGPTPGRKVVRKMTLCATCDVIPLAT